MSEELKPIEIVSRRGRFYVIGERNGAVVHYVGACGEVSFELWESAKAVRDMAEESRRGCQ